MNSWATARGGHVLSSRSRCRASTPMMQRVPALVAPPPHAHINIANKVGTQSPNNLAVVLLSGRTTGAAEVPLRTSEVMRQGGLLQRCSSRRLLPQVGADATCRGAHGDFCPGGGDPERSARSVS